jgi:hypothetical protein
VVVVAFPSAEMPDLPVDECASFPSPSFSRDGESSPSSYGN